MSDSEVNNEPTNIVALYCYGSVDNPDTKVVLGGATFQYINLIKDIAEGKITEIQFRNPDMTTVLDTIQLKQEKNNG